MRKSNFQVTVNGCEMGNYMAESCEEALEVYAQDAGYESFKSACEVAPAKSVQVVEYTTLTELFGNARTLTR